MNDATGISAVLQLLNPTNTISINRPLAHAIGVPESLIFSALISKHTYYSTRNRATDGWFFSTITDLQESTTYGEKAQKSAIRHLVDAGLIAYKLMGMPAKRYFRITSDVQTLERLIAQGTSNSERILEGSKKPGFASACSPTDACADCSSSAEWEEQVPPMVETRIDDVAEQDSTNGRNQFRRLGETCSCAAADKSKVTKPKGSNPNINQSYQSESTMQSAVEPAKQEPSDRMDGMDHDTAQSTVKENIEYDWFLACYQDDDTRQRPAGSAEELDEIVEIIVECICSTAPTIRVANQNMPQEVVKSQLLKLSSEHVAYVLQCLAQNCSEIRNIKAYLITTLYNAPSTFANYIAAAVRHDLPETIRKRGGNGHD